MNNMKKKLIKNNIKKIPSENGIYKIFVYNNSNNPISINRFAKTDKSGLIYIGRTANLKDRLYQFLASSSINMKTHNHSGGCKYKNIKIIKKKLGIHYLCFDYYISDEYINDEKKILKEYTDSYGEPPLLNK